MAVVRKAAIFSSFSRLFNPALAELCLQKRNYSGSLVGRDFLTLKQFNKSEVEHLLWTAADLKARYKQNKQGQTFRPLVGKSVAMIFQKRSTRTRLSTETGVTLMGGHACFLGPDDIHLGVNESVADSARVLARMTNLILARVYDQSDLDLLAAESNIPVVSGLSDLYHPLQALADLMTLQEHFGYLEGLKLAWVGDGNNILHSLMMGCPKLGIDIRIATPKGYDPYSGVMQDAINLVQQHETNLNCTHDPMEATYRANVVVTDTWVSMGQEEEKSKRMKDFSGYQVDKKMMDDTASDSVFLHCLPRKREEVTDDVFYGSSALVWQEAENRKWTVMSVILNLLSEYTPVNPKPNFTKPKKT